MKPGLYIFLGTIGWSFAPLIIEVSNAGLNPFAFYIWYGLGTAFGTTLFLFFYVEIKHKKFFNEYQNKTEDKSKTMAKNLRKILFPKKEDVAKYLNEKNGKDKEKVDSAEKESILKKVVNVIWHRKILSWAILGRLSIAFLALASGFVETEVATVLYEAWVIFYIVIRGLNQHELKSQLSTQNIMLFVFAAIGLLFINLSETGQFSGISIPGLLFALIGAVFAAISLERSIEWGERADIILKEESGEQNDSKRKSYSAIQINTVYTLVATIVMNLAVAGVSVIGVFVFNWAQNDKILKFENFFYSGFAWVFFITIILGSIEVIGYRKGGLETKNDKIFAIAYFMPIFSVIWLWIQSAISEGNVQVGRIDYFLIGISIVVAVNILLNYSVEKHRLGFKWLVISFWVCGVVVIFRDQWFTMWHGFDNWLWEGSTDYFAVLGLSTTVFVLVLSFRTIRINERTRHENDLVSSLYWKLWLQQKKVNEQENYAETENMINQGLADLTEIDASETVPRFDKKNIRAYFVFRKLFCNYEEKDKAEVYKNFDEMVLSKSSGRDLTEPLILIAFGASTILLALVTRPQFSGWNLFVSDSFSILFAATIAFMIFNLFDLRRERSTPILWTRAETEYNKGENKMSNDKSEQPDENSKLLLDEWFDSLPDNYTINNIEEDPPKENLDEKNENSKFEILFSFLLAIVIVIIFLILLYGKWITDWNWTSMLLPDSPPQEGLCKLDC